MWSKQHLPTQSLFSMSSLVIGITIFITLWILLMSIINWYEGYGPYGHRQIEYQNKIKKIKQDKKDRQDKKRRRATTPPRGSRSRQRRAYVDGNGELIFEDI